MQSVNFAGSHCCPTQQPSSTRFAAQSQPPQSAARQTARPMQFGMIDPVSIGAVCCCGCALPVAAVAGLAAWKGKGLISKAFGFLKGLIEHVAGLVEKFGMGKIADAATK